MENENSQIDSSILSSKMSRIHSRRTSHDQAQSKTQSSFELLSSFISKAFLKRASAAASAVDYASVVQASVRRANTERLREVFDRYASIKSPTTGLPEMTPEDFVRKYLGMFPEENYNKESVRLIASAADTTRDGMISFEEFQVRLPQIIKFIDCCNFLFFYFSTVLLYFFRHLNRFYALLMPCI